MTTEREPACHMRRVLRILVITCLAPALAHAQAPPPPAIAETQLGPLTLRPRFEIRQLGIDSNVFNEAEDPKEDFTGTFTPSLYYLLRMGMTELSGNMAVDLVYYRTYTDQRTVHRSYDIRFDVKGERVQPYVAFGVLDTRARLNAEVDFRAHRREMTGSAGTTLMLGSRTGLIVGVRYLERRFDDEVFDGVSLNQTLSADVSSANAGVRFQLTPLTALSFVGTFQRDRFPGGAERNSETIRIDSSVEFSPFALITGTASVGYRQFDPVAPTLAGYSGVVAAVSLSYTMLGVTRFDGTVNRDVQYSFRETEPYYLSNGARLTVTQRIVGPFDVQGVIGRERLDYRQFGATGTVRQDIVDAAGGGIGFRLGDTARLGFNVEFNRRRSNQVATRDYDRRLIYASLRYGF